MKLVKMFYEGRIVNFWLNHTDEKFSPMFATKARALEWITAYLFASYQGVERRRAVIDRRTDSSERSAFQTRNKVVSLAPSGRRAADHIKYEEIDEVSGFIEQFKGKLGPNAAL